ncbi:hypothetical protein OsI_08444 [Oryza sativa Indica Group]|uniref:Uncharacterized protein n=1 Tax=Oryza sativa subsp. indica TaxID=39946 RepID=B8AGF6_ORYSI|nr:hypothetical protein OsI_08444 [Oryza sativa Indica Group]
MPAPPAGICVRLRVMVGNGTETESVTMVNGVEVESIAMVRNGRSPPQQALTAGLRASQSLRRPLAAARREEGAESCVPIHSSV